LKNAEKEQKIEIKCEKGLGGGGGKSLKNFASLQHTYYVLRLGYKSKKMANKREGIRAEIHKKSNLTLVKGRAKGWQH
jgi:hypothetical protein